MSSSAGRLPVGRVARLSPKSVVALFLVSAALSGCAETSRARTVSPAGPKVSAAAPTTSSLRVAPTDALGLWKRTLLASRAAPGAASVVETHFAGNGSEHDVMQFSVVESLIERRGQVARYRLTYTAPASMKGIVILNDGRHVWRYNAQKRLIARQASVTAPVPPELEEGVAAVPIQSDGAHAEIEAGVERVAGRSTQVLAIRTRRSGRIVERRWVDRDTGRTLRLEQYAGRDAHLVRRVELNGFRLLSAPQDIAWASRQFTPTFPETARVVDAGTSHARHIAEAEDVARRADLPLHVRGFALRSVERMTTRPTAAVNGSAGKADALYRQQALAPATSPIPGLAQDRAPAKNGLPPTGALSVDGMTQFYYRKGNQAISIFASSLPGMESKSANSKERLQRPSLVARAGWRPAALSEGAAGYTCEFARGAAVVWTSASGGAYIAVSRMPLADLMPIVRAFAADRDDAPAASSAAR